MSNIFVHVNPLFSRVYRVHHLQFCPPQVPVSFRLPSSQHNLPVHPLYGSPLNQEIVNYCRRRFPDACHQEAVWQRCGGWHRLSSELRNTADKRWAWRCRPLAWWRRRSTISCPSLRRNKGPFSAPVYSWALLAGAVAVVSGRIRLHSGCFAKDPWTSPAVQCPCPFPAGILPRYRWKKSLWRTL